MRKPKPVNLTAKGRCVIPIENYRLLDKVVRRLERDGIPFQMEDSEEVRWQAINKLSGKRDGWQEPLGYTPQWGPCTVITFGGLTDAD